MKNTGSISMFVLVFGLVFTTLIGGLVMYGALESGGVRRSEEYIKALSMAEAGAYYYRWHLAHEPDDFQDGTGQAGPYVHDYTDPQSGAIGKFSLEITPPEEGNEIVTIKSTGWTETNPDIKRKLVIKFGPDSLTKYSFLHNANVWFGQGITIFGEVFSNGGVRMDGINRSVVRSAKQTYTCGSETGCSPSQSRPGVWGNGGPADLWQYPTPVFDFSSVVTDFSTMKQQAISSGLYLPPTGSYGYHLVFLNNGKFRVYRVTSASNYRGWSVEDGCSNLYQGISNQTQIHELNVSDVKIIYSEDTLFVDGTLKGKMSVVAARLPVTTYTTNAYIYNNLTYTTLDGSDNLGLIAQNNIIFARNIPNDFIINGALMAQSGRILRHHYNYSSCSSSSYAIRSTFTLFGSVISNQKSYWNFSGSSLQSGFRDREITFNQQAYEVPPPYFPTTKNLRIISWQEENM